MERIKMSRQSRAKQFAPFDALKGLQNALRMKEYEAERVQKGDLQEEKITEISSFLLNYDRKTPVEITFYEDEHNKKIAGVAKILYEERILKIENKNISFDDVLDIKFRS